MFSDILICVFSYNRGGFLKNLLESIAQYYPEAALAIFDDGSDDLDVKEILTTLLGGVHIHVTDKSVPDCKHGGLYNMMNAAIQYAKSSKYKYAYFVQDDMQFVWRDEQLLVRLKHVFLKKDCIMCSCSFIQKILRNDVEDYMDRVTTTGIFRFVNHGIGDTGVIDVEKAREIDLRFPHNSEKENGKYWYSKGFSLYWISQCNLAWVPWPMVYRYKIKEKRSVNKLYLDRNKIPKLKDATGYTFLEDYATTEKILIRPYWLWANLGYLNMVKIYMKYYLGFRLFKK